MVTSSLLSRRIQRQLPSVSTWPSGFAFILGFLAPLWTLGGFDGPIHISEEVSNASTAVPWAIVGSTIIAGVLGWGMSSSIVTIIFLTSIYPAINVAIAFNMGSDIEGILASPIGQPMATVCLRPLVHSPLSQFFYRCSSTASAQGQRS